MTYSQNKKKLDIQLNKNAIYNITFATSIPCMKDNISCMHSIKQKLKYILQWTLQVPRLLPTFLLLRRLKSRGLSKYHK